MKIRVILLLMVVTAIIIGTCRAAGELIINEFNAVGSEKYLNDGAGRDSFFDPNNTSGKITGTLLPGPIQGNGGDWIELVVTQDHLDIRGWQFRWAETGANEANGTDIWFGNGTVEQGILEFSDAALWSDLRGGTIITIVEEHTIYVDTTGGVNRTYNVAPGQAEAVIDLSTDTSFDPNNGDWWINVSVRDEHEQSDPNLALITSVHNVLGHHAWDWGCGNDDWQGQIYNPATATVVFDSVGEAVSGWGGSGINSREVGRVEANPSASINGSDFDDANNSSYGLPNTWGDPEKTQDFRPVRVWYYQPVDCHDAIAMGYGSKFDFDNNCHINLADFAEFAGAWLDCFEPGQAGCRTPWLD